MKEPGKEHKEERRPKKKRNGLEASPSPSPNPTALVAKSSQPRPPGYTGIVGNRVGGTVFRSNATNSARQQARPPATRQRGDAPASRVAAESSKRKKSAARFGGCHDRTEGPGAVTPPRTEGGFKRRGHRGGCAERGFAITGADASVSRGSKGSGHRCRPAPPQERKGLPRAGSTRLHEDTKEFSNGTGTNGAPKADRVNEGGTMGSAGKNGEAPVPEKEKESSMVATAAAGKAEASQGCSKGHPIPPPQQEESPSSPSPSVSTPVERPQRSFGLLGANGEEKHPEACATGTAKVVPSSSSASEAPMRSNDNTSSLSHAGIVQTIQTTPPKSTLLPAGGTKGGAAKRGREGGGGRLGRSSIVPSHAGRSVSPAIDDDGNQAAGRLWQPSSTPRSPQPVSGGGGSSSSSSSNNSNTISGSAESFVNDFLVDDVHLSLLPFAPAEAWKMDSSPNGEPVTRTSSASSAMMMMFTAGVVAGVTQSPPPGEGGRAGDWGGVAAPATALLHTHRAVSCSGSIGGGGGSSSQPPVTAAPLPSSRIIGSSSAPSREHGGNPVLIEHGRLGTNSGHVRTLYGPSSAAFARKLSRFPLYCEGHPTSYPHLNHVREQ